MAPDKFLKEWEEAVQGIERLRLLISNKSDQKRVQEMIVKLLDMGEIISKRIQEKE